MTHGLRYAITDGSANTDSILSRVSSWASTRCVDLIQIREKQLSASELYRLTARVIAIARPAGIEVLVNERSDVALAAGADGVHLPSGAISPAQLRKLGVRLISVSCHNAFELASAEREGADLAVLAPVFSPLSKTIDSPPLGLDTFHYLAKSVRIPVLALGGITAENTLACLEAGAAGVAGITLFNVSGPRLSIETAERPEPR